MTTTGNEHLTMGQRVERPARSREQIVLAGLAVVIGALSIATNAGPALHGVAPALCRTVLGVVGVVAGLLLWREPRRGWLLCMAWAVIQIPYYAWSTDGSPTTQILYLPLAMTSSTSVNGVVTSYSSVGINLVGVILAAWLGRRREELTQGD